MTLSEIAVVSVITSPPTAGTPRPEQDSEGVWETKSDAHFLPIHKQDVQRHP